MSAADAHASHLTETIAQAEGLLRDSLGHGVRLAQRHSYRDPGSRSTVLRCAVDAAGSSDDKQAIPPTVIVKRFLGDSGAPYDPSEESIHGAHGRMVNEWSGLRFMHSVEAARPFGPAPLAGDPQIGVVVLEDMGEGDALSDIVQRDGPDAAPAAEAALFAYVDTLGQMHGATAGRRDEYERVRADSGAGDPRGWDNAAALRDELLPRFRQGLDALALDNLHADWEQDVDAVAELIAAPGPFDAFSVSDTCPDNHRYIRGASRTAGPEASRNKRPHGYLRFFDFEFSCFRHSLIDAAYTWMPFPTCWCVNRLPDGLPHRLEDAYRRALAPGCPQAEDDALFGRGMAAGCIYWLVTSLGWGLKGALEKDRLWGISTHRQRHPLRAENTAAVCDRFGHFPAMSDLARRLATTLRDRWGEAAHMPLYPAFVPSAAASTH